MKILKDLETGDIYRIINFDGINNTVNVNKFVGGIEPEFYDMPNIPDLYAYFNLTVNGKSSFEFLNDMSIDYLYTTEKYSWLTVISE